MADQQALAQANATLTADPVWADLTRQIVALSKKDDLLRSVNNPEVVRLMMAREQRQKELGVSLPQGTQILPWDSTATEDHSKRKFALGAAAITGGALALGALGGAAAGSGGSGAAGSTGAAAAPGALSAPTLPAGLTTGMAPATVGIGSAPLASVGAPAAFGAGAIPSGATFTETVVAPQVAATAGGGSLAPAVAGASAGAGAAAAARQLAKPNAPSTEKPEPQSHWLRNTIIGTGIEEGLNYLRGRSAGNAAKDAATIQAEAAERAAKIEADAADKALALQRDMYQQGRADQAPYMGAGSSAIGTLTALMGLPSGAPAAAQTAGPQTAPQAANPMGMWPGLTDRKPTDPEIRAGVQANPNGTLAPAAPGTPLKPNTMSESDWAALTPEQKATYPRAGAPPRTTPPGAQVGRGYRPDAAQASAQAASTQTASTYRMRSPEGEEADVPAALVPHFEAMGATRLGGGLREGSLS